MDRPGVGTAVYVRKGGAILLGLRSGEFGKNTWCSPGGRLEMNESPLDGAVREVTEEADVEVANPRFIIWTNDIYKEAGTHYVTLHFVADWKSKEPQTLETETIGRWEWFPWDKLPEPLFWSTRNFVESGYNPFTL